MHKCFNSYNSSFTAGWIPGSPRRHLHFKINLRKMPEYHKFQICNRTFYISLSLEYIWLFVTWNVIHQPFVECTRKFRTHMWTSDLSCGRSSFTNIPFPVIAFRYLIELHNYLCTFSSFFCVIPYFVFKVLDQQNDRLNARFKI